MVSAEKILSLIDGLGGIVWEADPKTFQFSFVSAEAERILGYPVSDWLEAGFWQRRTHPDDVERCTLFCLEATRAGRDHVFEYRMVAADGRIVWLRDIVSVRGSPEGGTRLVGIMLDITKQKAEEVENERRSRLYQALIENSSDNIELVDASGVTLYQSPAIERQLGYPPGDVIGRNNFDLIHPEDLAMAMTRFEEALRSDDVIGPIRFRARHKNGSWIVLETMGKRYQDDGATRVIVNMRDITDVVEAQRALESTREQLAHAMKMEAIGRLAGGVAHDFNNLLTVIAGYAELLDATLEAGDSRCDDLDEIKRAAHRASLLTRQLLTFSRKQVVRPQVLDLNAVVREVGILIRRLIGEDIHLSIEPASVPLPVLADRSQLEQVLMNLAVNARDAMPLGGKLSIRTAAVKEWVHLTVTDTGSGMPPEVLGRMFEPFFTTKELGKGTGLGLSTAYGIIRQSGGDIQVSSELGEGTFFTITLPLARQIQEEPVEADSVPGGTDTILLIEDEKQVRELVEQVLTRLGYTVLVARDPTAAIELCKMHRQPISLLLTDIVMPHMSGPEIYQRIAVMVPGIAVLFMSGYMGDQLFARGVHEEAAAFLQKPFTPVTLARKVREVLDNAGRARRTG